MRDWHLRGFVDAGDRRNLHLVVIKVNNSVDHVPGALRHVKMVQLDLAGFAINNLGGQHRERTGGVPV
jgi:hypothetical protein